MPDVLYRKLPSIDLLKRAWHLARNDARTDFIYDVYRYNDFAFNLENNLKAIQDSLARETYHPMPLLEIDVPKSSLAVRPGSVPEIQDRIVTYAITCLIAPRLDKKLPETVYSFRLKSQKDRDNLFKDREILEFPFLKKKTIQKRVQIVEPWYGQWPKFMEATRYAFEQEGYKYLAVSDISSYFENINLEILRDILLQYLSKEQKIVNLLMTIFEFWTWRTHERRAIGRGIPQGNDVSSFLGNIYLLPLDLKFMSLAKNKDIKYFRYVDDVKIFAKDESVARELIFKMNDVLRTLHLNIQGTKTLVLTGEEIREEVSDPRLETVNEVIESIQKEKDISQEKRAEYAEALKEQYKEIKTRKRPVLGRNLRLFRRLLTGYTLLRKPYLVDRTLKELAINPDHRLMVNAVRYFRCFPNISNIAGDLAHFINSRIDQFALQEALMLTALRYVRDCSSKAVKYARRARKLKRKHWYVRVQAILLLGQLELTKSQLKALLKEYGNEINVEIKRALIYPLCQLEQEKQHEFLRGLAFEQDLKLNRIANMLIALREDKQRAIEEINSIFREWNEDHFIDDFYKIEVIKHSKDKTVLRYLRTKLKSKRRFIRRPRVKKRVDNTIQYLEGRIE